MTRRNLTIFGLGAAALLAVVALVAHGRPLAAGAGRGSGLPLSFWDFVFTSVVVFAALLWLATLVLVVLLGPKRPTGSRRTSRTRTFRQFAGLIAFSLLVFVIARYLHLPHGNMPLGSGAPPPVKDPTQRNGSRSIQFRWDEVAVLAGLVLVAVAVAVVVWRRRESYVFPSLAAPEAVVAALDESLDDLRADPDLRCAIIAAYARMERALAAAGVPRRPSEAPLEYLERALLGLDTSGPAVRRLTDLFEWARFSDHEPDRAMRDDAVDALEAVRDELRAPTLVPA